MTQVPWPHIRMKRPAKHGWFFSVFAGIFAIASIIVLELLILHDPIIVLESLISPSVSLLLPPVAILYLAACAFLATRVAGWTARALGSEDYGWAAGAITTPLFLAIYGMPAAWNAVDLALYHNRDWTELILKFIGFGLIGLAFVLPFCILGTAVFIGGVHLWSYSHRSDG